MFKNYRMFIIALSGGILYNRCNFIDSFAIEPIFIE